MKPFILFFGIWILGIHIYGQENESLKYLAQTPPTLIPEIFAPGKISLKDAYEFGSVFSENGKEFFYGVELGNRTEIRYSQLKDTVWTTPVTIISHKKYGYNDPFLSPDEQRLYYISNQPNDRVGDARDHDIWYSVRKGEQWSAPINAGKNINSNKNEYYMSFTNSGAMYFGSNKHVKPDYTTDYDIYVSQFEDGVFQPAKRMGSSVNTKAYEADVYIAPDESYVIFCATRRSGLGKGDLYISFRNEDGSWTRSKNMGAPINSANHELCPFVSKDGRYFFYTSNQDIYWVDAKIIEKLR